MALHDCDVYGSMHEAERQYELIASILLTLSSCTVAGPVCVASAPEGSGQDLLALLPFVASGRMA